ncbi:MAG: glycosyltransferase [Proteobacteria bacterium]|nr:glycosyltransferase [Pseudomonadota bacterium]
MRIWYQLGQFISHARAGRDNKLALLAAGHEIVSDKAQADVAILHDEPIFLSAALQQLQGLPRIAYAVVETDPMPQVYVEPLKNVDEVWTCSTFSRDILAREIDGVHVVPHVVTRPRFSKADIQRVRSLIGADQHQELFTFYTISDGVNRRKNLAGLLRTFASLGKGRARLVVKQYRHPLDLSNLPGVVSIPEELSDGEIAALHALGDCYVSAHCAEAWGLGLSEAMAFGKPVVATGYSGNMEFMHEDNSLPVRAEVQTIRSEDLALCPPFFTPDMRWAYVDEGELAARMRQVMRHELHRDQGFAQRAAEVARTYSPLNVGRIMDQRLQALVGGG